LNVLIVLPPPQKEHLADVDPVLSDEALDAFMAFFGLCPTAAEGLPSAG